MTDDAASPPLSKQWWEPLVEFLIHSVVGTAIFVIIFTPALCINYFLHKIENPQTISPWLSQVATIGEGVLVMVDLLLFTWFLLRTGVKAAKEF